MLNDREIEEKYGIIYIDKKRYYIQSIVDRPYGLETTTPIMLEFNGKSFVTNSWKQLLVNVFRALLNERPSKRDEMLSYVYPWNGKVPFYDQPDKYREVIGDEIFLLCNQSAQHACWLLRDVLLMFEVDLKKCKFIVHRPPHSEPKECREFYEYKIKNAFKYYYVTLLKHPEEKADRVIRNIEKLNKILAKCSLAYDNFFLIDDNVTFTNYRIKLNEYIVKNKITDDKNLEIANKYLNILNDFYKTIR